MLSLLFLSLALASTSRVPAPSVSAPSPIPVCGTVTKSQIEAAVGQLLNRETEKYTKLACIRNFSSDDVEVTISVQHLSESLDVSAEIASLKKSFPDSKLWLVDGLAGRAFALDIPGAGTQLHVLPAGNEYLLISVLGLDDAGNGYKAAMQIAHTLMDLR